MVLAWPGVVAGPVQVDESKLESLAEVERRHLLHVLQAVGNNKSLAARVLRIGRKTLQQKLERWARASAIGDGALGCRRAE